MNKQYLKICLTLAASLIIVSCSNNTQKNQTSYTITMQTKQHWPQNINFAANKIDFANSKTLGSLGQKWKRNNSTINIVHFGDSHIQPGWQVGPLRDTFQSIRGNAGRGMIFPYTIAKTYSQEDYSSRFTGQWKTANSIQQYPKIALGISGFVAKTRDPSTQVSFHFKKIISHDAINATLLFKADGDYRLTLNSGSQSQSINVSSQSNTQTVNFSLNNVGQEITLTIQAINPNSTFEFHGLNLTSPQNSGVVYHNLGVGGAAYSALIQQRLFEQQFPLLDADLVILDWGTNDVIYTNQIDENLETTIRQTIRKVRTLKPNAAILLTSVQEARYRGKNVTISEKYAQMVKRIAKDDGTLFYDWYTISGEHGSVANWHSLGFASKDGIHLNGKGYRIRAKLLGDAILKALENNKN